MNSSIEKTVSWFWVIPITPALVTSTFERKSEPFPSLSWRPLQNCMRCCFCSSLKSHNSNFMAIHLMFALLDRILWHIQYDNPAILPMSWLVYLQSSMITLWRAAIYSNIMPVHGHHHHLIDLLSMEPWAAAKKKLLVSVAVPPAPLQVPSQRPLAPCVASVTLVTNDKGDNEMISWHLPYTWGKPQKTSARGPSII